VLEISENAFVYDLCFVNALFLFRTLLEIASSGDNWSVAICEAIEALWGDEVIQTMFLGPRGNELNESSRYFFENLERYRDPDMYTPTAQDVLRARVRSTGIEEAEFKFDELKFRMFDVGGQVINCFVLCICCWKSHLGCVAE
jgi:guanine nucleotide-binding protein subunit alpha